MPGNHREELEAMKKPRLGRDPFKDEGPLSFIRDTRAEPAGKPGKPSNTGNTSNTKIRARAGKAGRPKGTGAPDREAWTRATFIVRRDRLEKLRAVAYWDRENLKRTLDRALESYLKGKAAKPVPGE